MTTKMKTKIKTVQNVSRGDCVEETRKLKQEIDLAIADPPYNFSQPYDAYDDNKSYREYMAWTEKWLGSVVARMHRHGSLWIFVPDEWVSEVDMLCRQAFALTKQRQVIWAFTFGQRAQKNFTRSHCHLLYMTKTKTKYAFNLDAVAVPSARQLVYNDRRAVASGKPPDDTWMLLRDQLEPYMAPDRDTWLVSRICGTFKERRKHSPNQIPIPIMERIVLACSNPGDLIVDPFCGTGSSGVACKLHGRNYEGFDVSKSAVKAAKARIAAA